jgi:geranylgeranyl diphosphate synthase type I
VGDDLRDGKPTPLLSVAVARAGAAQARLLERVGAADLSDAEVLSIQDVLVDTGAAAEIEGTIERLTAVAVAAIERAAITAEAQDALTDLAAYVARRAA